MPVSLFHPRGVRTFSVQVPYAQSGPAVTISVADSGHLFSLPISEGSSCFP
jgi:hypothetical protein